MKRLLKYLKLIVSESAFRMVNIIGFISTVLTSILNKEFYTNSKILILFFILSVLISHYQMYSKYYSELSIYSKVHQIQVVESTGTYIRGVAIIELITRNNFDNPDVITNIELNEFTTNWNDVELRNSPIVLGNSPMVDWKLELGKYTKEGKDEFIEKSITINGHNIKNIYVMTPFNMEFRNQNDANEYFSEKKDLCMKYEIVTINGKINKTVKFNNDKIGDEIKLLEAVMQEINR